MLSGRLFLLYHRLLPICLPSFSTSSIQRTSPSHMVPTQAWEKFVVKILTFVSNYFNYNSGHSSMALPSIQRPILLRTHVQLGCLSGSSILGEFTLSVHHIIATMTCSVKLKVSFLFTPTFSTHLSIISRFVHQRFSL